MGNFGGLWAIFGGIMGNFGGLLAILGELWVILVDYGQFWGIMGNFGGLWAILGDYELNKIDNLFCKVIITYTNNTMTRCSRCLCLGHNIRSCNNNNINTNDYNAVSIANNYVSIQDAKKQNQFSLLPVLMKQRRNLLKIKKNTEKLPVPVHVIKPEPEPEPELEPVDDECPICYNVLNKENKLTTSICSHSFCSSCICIMIKANKNNCALCRTTFTNFNSKNNDILVFVNKLQQQQLLQLQRQQLHQLWVARQQREQREQREQQEEDFLRLIYSVQINITR